MRALRGLNRSSSTASPLVRRPLPLSARRTSMIATAMAASHHSEEDAARLERAKSYPYARPLSSFVYINGHAFVFDCAAWPAVASGGAWLTDLPVRPPAHLLLGGGKGEGDDAAPLPPMSVVDACDRFFGFCARTALELPAASPSLHNEDDDDDDDARGRRRRQHFTPILAVGSNAGVEQLARKFPAELFPGGVVVPVVRALLEDHDVAYAPLVTSYGSTPATLHPSPGTRVELFVTHLSPRQARRMHETEGAYNLQRLSGVALREGRGIEHVDGLDSLGEASSSCSPTATELLTYGHQAGTLQLRFRRRRAGDDDEEEEDENDEHVETPVALAEIRARGRRFPALTQRQMLRAVRHALLLCSAEEEKEGGEEEAARRREGGTAALAASAASAMTAVEEAEDALPPPLPLPPILHPEHAEECWLSTGEPELDAFLLRCLDCADTRRRHVERLTAAAVGFERGLAPGCGVTVEVLQTMGTVLSDNVK